MAQDTARQTPAASATPARALLPLILPALVVGVAASLLFLLVSGAAERLQAALLISEAPAERRTGGVLPTALVVSSAAALLGLGAVYAFPYVHRAFRRLGHPMPALPAGGVPLGLLAALGGRLTLFKGLDEVGEPAADPEGWTAGQFATTAAGDGAAADAGARGRNFRPPMSVRSVRRPTPWRCTKDPGSPTSAPSPSTPSTVRPIRSAA
ncbi:hypothetical protein [Streptomyces sp. NPDC002588]|uniref:hypothetical protein n=1 Tax=Streptomyces sp. NPDC002588 TaxID=3154419 RepID=UPI0033238DFC